MTESEPGEAGETGVEAVSPVDCRVSLYVRVSPTSVGKRRQEDIESRLRSLAEDGTLPSLSVEQWGGQVTVDGNADPMTDLYDELAAAVSAVDARLEPFFGNRPTVAGMLHEPAGDRILTFPVVAIIVRTDGDIVGLYPCHRDGIHHRVEEAVDTLERGALPDNLA